MKADQTPDKKIRQLLRIFITAAVTCLSILNTHAINGSRERAASSPSHYIYVQASHGSFNHQAVTLLYQQENSQVPELIFSGPPVQTFKNAAENQKPAFVALSNDLVPGHLIEQTAQWLWNTGLSGSDQAGTASAAEKVASGDAA